MPSNAEHNQQKVSLNQFEETAVQEALLDLDVQKGLGPDGISRFILKKLFSVMLVPLTRRFCSICLYLLVLSLPFGKSCSSSQFLRMAKSLLPWNFHFVHNTKNV
jgi:hypothetical protein